MAYSDSDESYSSYDDGDEDYFSSVDSEGECSDDDGCQSDGDVVSDDEDDKPQAKKTDRGYVFETEADVRRCQDEVTARVSELLSIPAGFAAALLRHCRWDAERLESEWFSDERRIREAVGLTAGAPTAANDGPLDCAICFEGCAAGEMVSAGCSHFYCRECWRGYVHAAAGDGARCLLLRCPDPGCRVPVVRELVREVAAGEDRARYEAFLVRSYVEEGTSRYVRWCPGAGCTLAVRAEPGPAPYEVACECCKHAFCFRCGEEAHRPASCGAARARAAKNAADGESTRWVLAHTKHCPRCRRAIEKSTGCNHVTCGAPCGHEFCWLCLAAWADHDGGHYRCNRYEANREAEFGEEKVRRARAAAALDRYLHYYERWTAHGASMEKARRDLDALEAGALRGFADANGVTRAELGLLEEAHALIVASRRALRWSYAFVYYLDGERDGARRELCEHIQEEAERSLEDLSRCAEAEWDELKASGAASGDRRFVAAYADEFATKFEEYKRKLFVLNGAKRKRFSMLVEGFEAGMPEVIL